MKVKLVAIAALGKNREIGLNGKIPWDFPEEHQHFMNSIRDQYVLTSRKNLELHGGDIEGAMPLVLTRNKSYRNQNALVFHDLSEIISYAIDMEIENIFVLGGGEIFELLLPYITEFLWSEVDYSGPADTYFPDFSQFHWTKVFEEKHDNWKLCKLIKLPEKLY